mmetsp:Transcript_2109/g.6222  ORF Transcript_2109/g.6222 Transcript_2109/m.6222 type:complete len:336 (-) Transcript_2109:750-1757(-)
MASAAAPSALQDQTMILLPASADANKSPAGLNFIAVTSFKWPWRTFPGVMPSKEPASPMLKRWMSNWEFWTPAETMPSGLSKAMAMRPVPGEVAIDVGRLGTASGLDHSRPPAPRQWKLFLPPAMIALVSCWSSHAAPTTNSLMATGSPENTQPSKERFLAQSSNAKTQASGGPAKPGPCAKMCWMLLPTFALRGAWSGHVAAMNPSPPAWIKAPVAASHARHVSGPCVPSTVAASVAAPLASTSQRRIRPSKHTEMMRLAVGQATPTNMSSSCAVPTCASQTWAPASRSQMRNFLSPPAVTTFALSGDQAAAQRDPAMPAGFSNSFSKSPSLPS